MNTILVKINREINDEIANYCKEKGLIKQAFINKLLKDALKNIFLLSLEEVK